MKTRVPLPKFISRLLDVLEAEFPDAWLDVQRKVGLDEYHFTVAVVSSRFRRMGWKRRHELLWDIAKRSIRPKQYQRTAMLPLRPVDLEDMTGEKFDPTAEGRRCKSAHAPPIEVLTFRTQVGALRRRAGSARRKLSRVRPV